MTNTSQTERLSLYHYRACPYCGITQQALKTLDLEVEQKDIMRELKFRQELVKGGGKSQVPCLKIENSNGSVEWLYESSHIIRYLRRNAVKKNGAVQNTDQRYN